MPVQLVGFSYGPFILLAIPSFYSYEPQTPTPSWRSIGAFGWIWISKCSLAQVCVKVYAT